MDKEKNNHSADNSAKEGKWEMKFEKECQDWEKRGRQHKCNSHFFGGGFYFFGIIASAVYYIQQVDGFGPIILALLKALVWPVLLIYKIFQLINM
ncbi:MAG: hypothetical protein ACOZBH_00395 [Patescibacteria group bacterium]